MKPDQFTITIVLLAISLFRFSDSSANIQSCIGSTKSTITIVTRGESNYDTLNFSQNIRKLINPLGFIVVKSTSDVSVAIKCFVKLKIKFAVKCGGHSYEQYSYGSDNGWVIDVSGLKTFKIDKTNLIATVGAGFIARELTKLLWENGKFSLPVGSCGGIGISGYTLGGGIGITSRQNGVMLDRVIEMEVVTADGRIVRANKQLNSSLFWALRGAGGSNFGIVTEFKFKVFDASPEVVTVTRSFDFSDFVHHFHIWQRLVDSKPDNSLSSEFACLMGSCTFVTVIVTDKVDVREATLRKVKEIFGDLKDEEIKRQTFFELLTEVDIYTFSYYLKATSFFVSRSLSENEVSELNESLSKPASSTVVYFSFNILGGAVNAPHANATAFCHRNSNYLVQFGVGGIVTDPALVGDMRTKEIENEHFVSEFLADIKFMENGESYQNYIDAELRDWLQRYYCGNVLRLTSLKRQYDPMNVFQFKQSIPLDFCPTHGH